MDAVSAEREEQLDALLADYFRAEQAGSAPGRDEFIGQHPEFRDALLEFFADREAVDRATAPLRQVIAVGIGFSLPRDFGPYRLIEELGRGGMGVVYRAHDPHLERQVALKILPQGPLASVEDRLRLRIEAEAIARLGYHPHIVPVLEVGDAEGHAFLTMQLIAGPTLASLKQLYRHQPREAALLIATLAETLHHAHLHGITHRDLKPSNILMAGTSERSETAPLESYSPVVSDFGLARVPAHSTHPRPTLSGAILGTPAYMAPEQARGEDVTLAVDVYGLGAILYELLTQRVPHEGTPLEILRRLGEQEPTPPRRVDPRVPRDLETICLKCLAREPEQRYGTARELADDLHRYLRGEPVLARPLGTIGRLTLWVWRQPLVAGLMAALVLALVGGSIVSTLLWWRAETELARAERESRNAEMEAIEAEASFALAHEVVHDFCLEAATRAEPAEGLSPQTRTLLERALGYYDRFLQRHTDDPTLRSELAQVNALVGRTHLALGQRREGLLALREAKGLYERLHRDEPRDARWMRGLVGATTNLGVSEGTTRETLEDLNEGLALTARFLKVHPTDVDLCMGQGHTLANLGALYERRGDRAEARRCYEQAVSLLRDLGRDHPANTAIRRDLAFALTNLAGLRSHDGDAGRPDSLRAFAEARALREQLLEARPNDSRRQADLAHCLHKQAVVLRDAGEMKRAQAGFAAALRIRQELVDRHPTVLGYLADLASTMKQIAFNVAREDRARAIEPYRRAVALLEQVVKAVPEDTAFRRELGLALFSLGSTHGALNQRPEERAAFERGAVHLRWLIERDSRNLDAHHHLARVLHNLAFNLAVTKQPAEAIEKVTEAAEHSRRVLERATEHLPFRTLLDIHYLLLAEIHWKEQQPEESLAAIHQRQLLWPKDGARLYHSAKEIARLLAIPDLASDQEVLLWRELETALALAARAGFTDWDRVQKDGEFAPLRGRQRLREILDSHKPRR